MAEATQLDPAYGTPSKVIDGVLMAHKDRLSFTRAVTIPVTTMQTTS
jgi:hypothetical protein